MKFNVGDYVVITEKGYEKFPRLEHLRNNSLRIEDAYPLKDNGYGELYKLTLSSGEYPNPNSKKGYYYITSNYVNEAITEIKQPYMDLNILKVIEGEDQFTNISTSLLILKVGEAIKELNKFELNYSTLDKYNKLIIFYNTIISDFHAEPTSNMYFRLSLISTLVKEMQIKLKRDKDLGYYIELDRAFDKTSIMGELISLHPSWLETNNLSELTRHPEDISYTLDILYELKDKNITTNKIENNKEYWSLNNNYKRYYDATR